MAFGFAAPYQSRLGSIASRAAAAAPKMLAVSTPAMDLSHPTALPSLPSLSPSSQYTPMQTQSFPALTTQPGPQTDAPDLKPAYGDGPGQLPTTPVQPPASMPSAAGGVGGLNDPAAGATDQQSIQDLIAALFGG